MKNFMINLSEDRAAIFNKILNKAKKKGLNKQHVHEVCIDLLSEIEFDEIVLRISKNIANKIKQ